MKKTTFLMVMAAVLFFTGPAISQPTSAPVLTATTNGLNVTMSWTSVAGATGYRLLYAPMPWTGPSSVGQANVGAITSLSADLWEGASFVIAVRAWNSLGDGPLSNIAQFDASTVRSLLLDSGGAAAVEFGTALAQCGAQSHNTTPDAWGEVAVLGGTDVCAVWTPPGWNALRLGEGFNLLYEDETGYTTITIAGGTTWEVQSCTFENINNWWLQKVHDGGCFNPVVEWRWDFTLDVAGVQIPNSLFTFTCNKNGVTEAGLYQTQIHSQGFPCQFRVDGYMVRRDDINANMCTLSQILNSLKCLEGQANFKCTKPQCSLEKKAQGFSGGFCNSFDECVGIP
ncbi:MAG: fibronectin type III domain-containing protein [Desulfobacterales bacterium]|nr:fibronectin type III domain-containing protein [Desulfobacterales bacterium]